MPGSNPGVRDGATLLLPVSPSLYQPSTTAAPAKRSVESTQVGPVRKGTLPTQENYGSRNAARTKHLAIIFSTRCYVAKQQHVMSLESLSPHLHCTRFTAAARSAGTRKCRLTAERLGLRTRGQRRRSQGNSMLDQSLPENNELFVRTHPRTTQKKHLALLIGTSPRSDRGSTSSSGAGILRAAAGYPHGT